MREVSLSTISAPDAASEQDFDFDSGALCLDFANSLRGRLDPETRETLHGYRDIVAFVHAFGALDAPTAAILDARAARDLSGADAAYTAALGLREVIFRIFAAIAAEAAPAPEDLALLNAAVREAAAHSRIVPRADAFGWEFDAEADLTRPAWSIARSAADLLTGDQHDLVRECAADDCAWLFIDTSRNHSRRWCSMSSCGNRAKVHQFRQRKREGSAD